MEATDETEVIRASRQAPESRASCQPPAACICPLSTIAIMGTRAQVIQVTTRSIPARSSEWMVVNWRASAVIFAAREVAPTAVSRTLPDPPITDEADRTLSPGTLPTGSFSPVSRDSSRSRPSLVSTTASAGTWSPRLSSTTSSRTSLSRATGTSLPSRRAVAGARRSRAIRSSWRFAENSWVKPITTLAIAAKRKRVSSQEPTRITASPQSPSTRLNMVKRWVRIMVAVEREVALFCVFTDPAEVRSATCSLVRPRASRMLSGGALTFTRWAGAA